jgi:hypothetical protein
VLAAAKSASGAASRAAVSKMFGLPLWSGAAHVVVLPVIIIGSSGNINVSSPLVTIRTKQAILPVGRNVSADTLGCTGHALSGGFHFAAEVNHSSICMR